MGKIDRLKEIVGDPRWLMFHFQRQFQDPARRQWFADRLSSMRPTAEVSDARTAAEGAEDLRQSGLHHLGQMLTQEQCDALLDYFKGCLVRDPYRKKLPHFVPLSDGRPAEAHIAHHNAADIVNAPYLMDIANDPRVLDVAGAFLGCKPTIGYIATWWSYPTGLGPQQAENLHRDVDDWRFVKLFLYLTEVHAANGPHKYVLQSSKKPIFTKIRRFEDAEVAEAFGEENICTMTSKAGQAFLEDTHGFHKGEPVQKGHRLVFQVVYTLNPLPYAPKQPVKAGSEAGGYDRYINRVYLK